MHVPFAVLLLLVDVVVVAGGEALLLDMSECFVRDLFNIWILACSTNKRSRRRSCSIFRRLFIFVRIRSMSVVCCFEDDEAMMMSKPVD